MKRRLKSQPSWRECSKLAVHLTGLSQSQREEVLPTIRFRPWQSLIGVWISDQLVQPCWRRDPVPVKNYVAAESLTQMLAADIKFWTNLPAIVGNKYGNRVVFITRNPIGHTELVSPAGRVAYSYEAEKLSLLSSLIWMTPTIEFT